jgi:hypothetical protein
VLNSSEGRYISNEGDGQWIEFRFLKHVFLLTNYAMKSGPEARSDDEDDERRGVGWLSAWKILVGEDGQNWWVVDEYTTPRLQATDAVATFAVTKPKHTGRIIRFVMTAPNSSGRKVFDIAQMEFFGTLDEPIATVPE